MTKFAQIATMCVAVGGLTLAAGRARSLDGIAESSAAFALVMKNYNTEASKDLKTLELNFNKDLPAGVPPIVFTDYDKIATWFGMPEGPATVEDAIGDYLKDKTGRNYDKKTLAQLAQAMNTLDAEGIVLPDPAAASCLVVPVYPGLSFKSFYASSFRVGLTDVLRGVTGNIGLSTMEFARFADAHETWHCLDFRYIRDSGDGLEGAVKQNRTEMFADIGGAMEGIRAGADLTLIDRAAAIHAAWAFLTGPAHGRLPEENPMHFQSIVYATLDGLTALRIRIQKMGIAKFRQLNREQMRAVDYEITDAHCITYQQAAALQSFFASGQAPAAALPLIMRMKAIAKSSVHEETGVEITARKKYTEDAASNGGLTEEDLLGKLKARARELGDATSLANQLQARQEMTDQLREKLMHETTCERVTESQLKLLLYTNPRLVPRQQRNTP